MLKLLVAIISLNASGASVDDSLNMAVAGDPEAQHTLCYSYLYGQNGREKDLEEAAKWCKKAADAGVSSSMVLLAEMYRFGGYFKKSDKKARELYLQAASAGHVHAQFMLGFMALTSEEQTQKSVYETCFWLKAAADKGYEKAISTLDKLESVWKSDNPDSERDGFCNSVLAAE